MEVLMRLKIAGEPATFTLQGDTFQWRTKYNPDLVADMRLEIPNTAKAWHNGGRDDRYWTISADYFEKAKELSTRHGYEVVITGGTLNQLKPGSHTFDLDYMGLVRDRSDGTQTATGWVNGYWNAVFKLDVLQAWFNFKSKIDCIYIGPHQSEGEQFMKKLASLTGGIYVRTDKVGDFYDDEERLLLSASRS
jgi:hypothetical protein